MGASYFRFWSRAETAMRGPRPLITSTTIVFTFQNFFPRNDNFIFFFYKIFFELKKKVGPADANAIRRVPCALK